MPTTPDAERLLRDAGLRVTRARVAALTAVRENPHLGTEAILGRVRAELGAVSHQGVYDVLRALTAAGLLRRIEPEGSTARYETRVADNHHHAVCRGCGAITDVDCAAGGAPCLTASNDHGFVIDEAEILHWGRCPECARTTTSQESGGTRRV